MQDIGSLVRELRDRSPYRDLRSFASQNGLSYEGLRKIEIGERIPSIDTIDHIIQAVDLTKDQAQELRRTRDLAHADREGLLDKGVTDGKMDAIALACFATVTEFLEEFDMVLTGPDQTDLRNRVLKAVQGELCA